MEKVRAGGACGGIAHGNGRRRGRTVLGRPRLGADTDREPRGERYPAHERGTAAERRCPTRSGQRTCACGGCPGAGDLAQLFAHPAGRRLVRLDAERERRCLPERR